MITGRKLSEKLVYSKFWMRVHLENHEISDKGTFEYITINAPNWVITIPETADGKLILVKQYRPGWTKTSIEFPAGRLNIGEDPIEGAKRELVEETGFRAGKIAKLIHFRPIVWSKQVATLYYATELDFIGQNFDEEENIEVMQLEETEIEEFIQSGDIEQAATIMAFYKWKLAKINS